MKSLNIELVDQVGHEHPAVDDSQANGSIENGVKLVMSQLRTRRVALETRIGARIPINHPAMAWMTSSAALLLSLFSVGLDGHTSYERLRGKPFKTALSEFGEMVWYHIKMGQTPSEMEKGDVHWHGTHDCRGVAMGR